MQIFAKNVTIRDDLPAVATEIKLEAGFTILFKSNFGTWKFNIYILNQFNKFWPNSKKKKEIIFSVSYMLAGEGGVRNFKNSSWNCNPWLEVRLCLHSATITTRIQEQIIHMPAADLFVFMCIYYIYTSMSELINESKF